MDLHETATRALRSLALPIAALALAGPAAADPDPAWEKPLVEWRARAEKSLRADNGWLTLAGRFVMKPGANTFGTGQDNDIVFARGLGPERMGTITVAGGKVTMKLAPGLTVRKEGMDLDEVVLGTDLARRDWVTMGRLAMHVIAREGRYVLRLADNESEVRKGFHGRVWYAPDPAYRVQATFVPYPPGRKVTIINVLDEASDEPSPGYVQFELAGRTHRLDAVGDDEGLFFVLRDATAGDTTYRPGRFLYVPGKPEPGKPFELDLNRVYNPPCAFSEFTTCPLPPKQNILKVRIEAGEKYPPRRDLPAPRPMRPRAAVEPAAPATMAAPAPLLPPPAVSTVAPPAHAPMPVPDGRGGTVVPGPRSAIDPKTGASLIDVGNGWVDPVTGRFVPKP